MAFIFFMLYIILFMLTMLTTAMLGGFVLILWQYTVTAGIFATTLFVVWWTILVKWIDPWSVTLWNLF